MTSAEIAHTLRISPATAKRRLRELKGKDPRPGRAFAVKPRPPARQEPAPPAPPAESSPDLLNEDEPSVELPLEFSPDSTLQEIDKWLKVAKERAEAAAADDNPKAHAEYMRMIITLIEARRKAAPPPKVDPNDHPDMVAAAANVRKRWHNLADMLAHTASAPIAESIRKVLEGKRPWE